MTHLRPLKTVELRDIFSTLDSGNKGSLDKSDLHRAYTLMGSKSGLNQEEVDYVLEHLIQVGGSSFNSLGNNPITSLGSKGSSGYDGVGLQHGHQNLSDHSTPKLDLTTFVGAVNHVLSTNSLETLLKSTFDSISVPNDNFAENTGPNNSSSSSSRSTSSTNSNRVVTVSQLLDLASRFGLKLSKDSEIRLQARVPNGSVDFNQFVELVSST